MKKNLFLCALAVVVIMALSQFSSLRSYVRGGVFLVANPLWGAEQFVDHTVNEYTAYLRTKRALEEENATLRAEIARGHADVLENSVLREENRLLEEKLGREFSERKAILGTVLSKPNRTPYDTLIIDAGAYEGVMEGDRVAAYEHVIIGSIVSVYDHTSVVKLFSSPGEEIDISIGNEKIVVTARGIGGGNFETQIPKGIEVHEGDSISFPAISTEIAGVVEKVEVSPADALQTVLFKIPVNLFELQFVAIFH